MAPDGHDEKSDEKNARRVNVFILLLLLYYKDENTRRELCVYNIFHITPTNSLFGSLSYILVRLKYQNQMDTNSGR